MDREHEWVLEQQAQARAHADAEKASAPVPPPAESDELESEYVPLQALAPMRKSKLELKMNPCHCKPFARVRMQNSRHGDLASMKDVPTNSMTCVVQQLRSRTACVTRRSTQKPCSAQNITRN